jgi:UDP-glucose 4-epimerase
MRTIAVTGSSGFIGSHLVNHLTQKGYHVIKLDYSEGIDLLNKTQVLNTPEFDTIIHLAAKSFVPQSFKDPWDFYNNNLLSTLNVLELARKYSAKVIFLSSYLYGNPVYLPIDELHPLQPHNPYSRSKLICEKLCEGYFQDYELSITIFRPFNIYGPGQNKSFLIPSILDQFKSGEIVLKDSRPKRDFIHVFDVVQAIVNSLELNKVGLNTYNLGSGKSLSIPQLIDIIKDIIKTPVKVTFTNEIRSGEVLETLANTALVEKRLNWHARIEIFDGLKGTIDNQYLQFP